MITDILGTVLGVANTINTVSKVVDSFSDREESRPVEIVKETQPVVVQSPQQNTPPITLNLTINVYKDGKEEVSLGNTQKGLLLDLK